MKIRPLVWFILTLFVCMPWTRDEAQSEERVHSQSPPRHWVVQFLRDGEWHDRSTSDTRELAQAKLDAERKAYSDDGANTLHARVVPSDWSRWEKLGQLSAKYESGGRGSGTVSTGSGDPGGVSYGTYQLSSNVGTAQRFVNDYYSDWFRGSRPGSGEFTALWKQLAEERTYELSAYEHLFIAETHYVPFANRLRDELSLDPDGRSAVLRDVAWSTAVQHGPRNQIFHRALEPILRERKPGDVNDRMIIERVYQERGRVDSAGVPVYFPRASKRVQQAVLSRFKREGSDALEALAENRPKRSS